MRVAILGGGCAGACAALELAANGHDVDLYDENAAPISRASRHNEGKIHLGLLYANDTSLRTARTMIAGALRFASCLNRWIDFNVDTVTLSTPFHYAVHRSTMVGVDELERHYDRCRRLFEEMAAASGLSYLGLDEGWYIEQLARSEVDRLVSAEHFLTVFRTCERAVDPYTVGSLLREALRASPRITFLGDTRVTNVVRAGSGRLVVHADHGAVASAEPYEHVANTLWHGRLEIDATLGLGPSRPCLHRYKFANRIRLRLRPETPPSLTCVLGPFGDIVNFGDRGLFLSWYPTGMVAMSSALRPPEWDQELTSATRHEVFRRSHREWLRLCPELETLVFDEADVDPSGGIIMAWGSTDIDDPRSELHTRFEIGVHSVDNYHSVNTGKYTTAPLLGLETAERILGLA